VTFHPLPPLRGVALTSLQPSGDTTGASDVTAINNALSTTAGAAAVLGAGTFYIKSDLLLQAAGQQLVGQGINSTIISPVNSGASFTNAMVNVTADRCGIRDLTFQGLSGTVTSNTAVSAVQINGGFHTFIRNIEGINVNGWLVDLESTSSATNLNLRNVYARTCAGAVKLEGNGHTVGTTLDSCGSAQIGVGSGTFANLDALLIHNAFDVTATNCNFSVGNSTTGHGAHLLGHVSNVWYSVFDMGGFPVPTAGSGQCGIMIEDDGTGHASTVHFANGVLQTWDIGAYVKGPNAFDVHFTDVSINNNNNHGARVDTTFANPVWFEHCQFGVAGGANGQGAATLGTNIYDIDWTASSSGRILHCDFNSPIVSVSTIGVQNSIALPSSNATQVVYPRFTGTSAASTNWFTNTPANLAMVPITASKTVKPANPSTTVSLTLVMMGLGAAASPAVFTPTLTGIVRVTVVGVAGTNTGAVNYTMGGRYGTSTAPSNGAAVSGTAYGVGAADWSIRSPAAGSGSAFALSEIITGLTPGTQYWFDIALDTSNASDAAFLQSVCFTFQELTA